jgi:phage terminase Nu1 subunit (DNA packaging protein)
VQQQFHPPMTDGDPARLLGPECYVDRAGMAQLMGVSVATIDRMVAEGMPSETWGMRARRFRPSIALAWARTRRSWWPAGSGLQSEFECGTPARAA